MAPSLDEGCKAVKKLRKTFEYDEYTAHYEAEHSSD